MAEKIMVQRMVKLKRVESAIPIQKGIRR
jgi:hypothetical protein